MFVSFVFQVHASLIAMKICATVKFTPDRPSELVSSGYDSRLLHHDFHQRTVLSRFDLGNLTFGASGYHTIFNISHLRNVSSARVFRCFNVSTVHIVVCYVTIWHLGCRNRRRTGMGWYWRGENVRSLIWHICQKETAKVGRIEAR